jgi:hypothetical protein
LSQIAQFRLKKEDYNGSAPDMGIFESYHPTIVNDCNVNESFNLSNYPNPFNSTTIIQFSLLKESHVSLSIYTITGQKVIDLLEKSLTIGNYQTQWNGRDKSGNKISSGVYIIRLNAGNRFLSKRILYMK